MVTSSAGASNLAGCYSGLSADGSGLNTLSGSGLPAQDSIILPLDTSLIQSLPQSSSAVSDAGNFPTNIQQTAQNEEILTTNTNLAQTVSQQVPSPLLESQMEALQTLPAENESTQSDQSLTSLATSLQVLQNITSTGILASNPSLTQSLMQNYILLMNPTSLGSLGDTSAWLIDPNQASSCYPVMERGASGMSSVAVIL